MVGPSSHSRPWMGETPTSASSAINGSQRGEGEANRPQGQRPARVSRGGSSWTEFVRLADQAVVAFGNAGMINRAEFSLRRRAEEIPPRLEVQCQVLLLKHQPQFAAFFGVLRARVQGAVSAPQEQLERRMLLLHVSSCRFLNDRIR